MRVAHNLPATWRGRTTAATLDIREHAIATMRRLTEGLDLKRVRALSKRVLALVHKGRSDTQTPGPLERVFEILFTLKKAGVPEQQLRAAVVSSLEVIHEAESAPATVERMLAAVHTGNSADAAESLAESTMLTRADREITIGDLDRLEDATRAKIAADEEQLSQVSRVKRQFRSARASQHRHGMGVVRGGLHT